MPSLLMVTTVSVTLRAFLLPFANHFRKLGWRVDALAAGVTSCPDCVAGFDKVWDAPWSRKAFDLRNITQGAKFVRRLAEREGYQLVHVHTPVAAFVTRYGLRHLNAQIRPKVIYTAHGFHFYEGGPWVQNTVYRTLEQIAGKWTDHLIVMNRDDQAAAIRYRLVSSGNLNFMPGIGVDTRRLDARNISDADVSRVRSELGLTRDNPLFLMIAEFNPGKRHRDALRAFAQLDNRQAHLAFAGVGPHLEAVAQLGRDLGVDNRVHFLGFRTDIPTLIRASVATVLPSEREGLPRSVMESLCLGVPVIGSDIRGTRDLLGTGGGILVPVADVAAISRAMQWVLENADQSTVLGELGRQAVGSYDLRAIIRGHEELYAKALSQA